MNAAPKTLRQLSELSAAGLAAPERRAALEKVAAQYAVAITPPLAELIDRADPHDPIARQFVPDAAELDTQPHESADPIGDHAHAPVAGIVHRYPDRVLLKLTATCAVYCRFCFRREMVGPDAEPLTPQQLDAALGYIAAHPDIWEVILTGGDPLVLSARRIAQVMSRLAAIDHVKVVRVHTRMPVAEPVAHHAGTRRGAEGGGQGRCTWCCTPTIRANSRRRPARPAPCWSTPASRC